MISSVMKTATQESSATVVRLLLLRASITATTKPTVAETTYFVAVKTAGTVIAVRTA